MNTILSLGQKEEIITALQKKVWCRKDSCSVLLPSQYINMFFHFTHKITGSSLY